MAPQIVSSPSFTSLQQNLDPGARFCLAAVLSHFLHFLWRLFWLFAVDNRSHLFKTAINFPFSPPLIHFGDVISSFCGSASGLGYLCYLGLLSASCLRASAPTRTGRHSSVYAHCYFVIYTQNDLPARLAVCGLVVGAYSASFFSFLFGNQIYGCSAMAY